MFRVLMKPLLGFIRERSMIKILIFLGVAFLAFVGSIVVWVALPPKFTAQAMCDEGSRTIRCIVSVARSLGLKIRLTSIWIPVEYLRAFYQVIITIGVIH